MASLKELAAEALKAALVAMATKLGEAAGEALKSVATKSEVGKDTVVE